MNTKPEWKTRQLDMSRFVVMGEGLAAGVGDFALSSDTQRSCFPAQMAKQMNVDLAQRLLQPPGIGNLVGFTSLPILVPSPMQTTMVEELPPTPTSNLAVPGFRLQDAVELRPKQPLIHRKDAKQTAVNLNWGFVPISRGENFLLTQLDYAIELSPTLTVVELGYYEVLEAAVNDDPDLLPEPEVFARQFSNILNRLRQSGSEVLALNVPDPLSTAHFFSVQEAAKLLKVEPAFLTHWYSIKSNDILSLSGVTEIAYQMFAKAPDALSPKAILSPPTSITIASRIRDINRRLMEAATANAVLLYDLAGLFHKIAASGYQTGTKLITGEYLGGFYSLNGYYPGGTGQAIIANELLALLNQHFGSGFAMININPVASADPVTAYQQAGGPAWSSRDLEQLLVRPERSSISSLAVIATPDHCEDRRRADWTPLMPTEKSLPLRLPAGLEQVLPLSKAASYFGDGISPVNARDTIGIQWGTCGSALFGGLAMVDSHLIGSIRIKFQLPADNLSHFEIFYEGGFIGEDSELAAPQYFKMAFKHNRVDEVPGMISSGTLNLASGEVSDLKVYAHYSSSALSALVGVNPSFPKQPLTFPGQYGSAWAEFEQRMDGKLDFSFYGSTFVPLGKDIVWPLNFVGPSGQFATIPAAGTTMHPHLALNTKEPAPRDSFCSEVPFNSLQEFTLFTHNSAFGDAFRMHAKELGGTAIGRSHLLGRLQVQFGPRTGNTVPVCIRALPAGGILAPLTPSPVTDLFPGRLSAGPQGFNESLRFPLRTYPLDDLSIIDDPFDISIGAIDLCTGSLVNDLLHRAFISQDLLFAILRVEPRTPKDSFFFRGPAVLVDGAGTQSVFRFRGLTHLPYPTGFAFPRPDFATAIFAEEGSALDPYLWFHAIGNSDPHGSAQGEAQHIRSSTGDDVSCRYWICADSGVGKAFFEYENHTQAGTFRLHSLAWVDFCDSGTSPFSSINCDTVTFSGFGVWSKDGVETLQQVAAQVCTSPQTTYLAIQVASGDISNVNTRPPDARLAFP